MTRRYFTMDERMELARMWRACMEVKDIAAALGRHDKVVYRELKRGYDGTVDGNLRRNYDPVLANNRFRQIMSERGHRNASKKPEMLDC